MPIDNDEIRDLCILASVAEGDEFQRMILKLKIALREHIADTENRNMAVLPKMPQAKLKDGSNL